MKSNLMNCLYLYLYFRTQYVGKMSRADYMKSAHNHISTVHIPETPWPLFTFKIWLYLFS